MSVASVVAGTVLVHWLRHLPWSLAAIVGLAIGVLVVSTLRTGARLRSIWSDEARRRGPQD